MKDREDFLRIQLRLFDAYGREHLTPTYMVAITQLADLVTDLVKPGYVEKWLMTPANAFDGKSLVQCVEAHDLDTPLGWLSGLREGSYV